MPFLPRTSDISRLFLAGFAIASTALVAPALANPVLEQVRSIPSTPKLKAPALPQKIAKQFGKALPDGRPASAQKGDIHAVWLTQPTGRYGHGILGDATEAGGFTIKLANGDFTSYSLPQNSVFEDIAPRIADLDGDGRNEIVLIRAYLDRGAALSVFGLKNGTLSLLAETPAIGTPNRWLNPSILADLDGSGRLTIGLVRTPHIGGQLQLWRYEKGALRSVGKKNGFSNHTIGSRVLGLSAILKKGDERVIALPDARQSNLLFLDAKTLKILGRLSLPARPVGDFVVKEEKAGKQSLYLPLANGKSYRITDPDGTVFK